jgi:hypothetical protein
MQRVFAVLLLCAALGYLLMRFTAGVRRKKAKGGCCGCKGTSDVVREISAHR